jgi:hypothetical protein
MSVDDYYWPRAQSRGTLTIGCNASAVYCKGDKAAVVAAPLELPPHVNLNDYVGAVIRCIGNYAFTCHRIIIFELEPKSQIEEHAQEFLMQSVRLFARARGIETVFLSETNIEIMNVPGLTEGWERSIEGFTIESLRRIALGRNDPFGVIVDPFNRKRFCNRRAFYELLHAATRKQLHWSDYESYREKIKGMPMGLRSYLL